MGGGSRRAFAYSPWRPLRVVPAILMLAIPTIFFMFFLPGGLFGADPARWGLILIFLACLGYCFLKLVWMFTRASIFTASEDGIEARSRTGSSVYIRWSDVQSVRVSPDYISFSTGQDVRIQPRYPQAKIVFHNDLPGYEELKTIVLERTGNRSQ
ncbi:MAG: hypothetical protein M1319_02685 [Chloroflexi bacterium]|nr:hypothetical protein [Chloroflexota bacterium]